MKFLFINIIVLINAIGQNSSYPIEYYHTPVCAFYKGFYKTFASVKDLMREIRRTGSYWYLIKLMSCDTIFQTCTNEKIPICAYSEVLNEFRTFINECQMNREIHETGVVWKATFPFGCPSIDKGATTQPKSNETSICEMNAETNNCTNTNCSGNSTCKDEEKINDTICTEEKLKHEKKMNILTVSDCNSAIQRHGNITSLNSLAEKEMFTILAEKHTTEAGTIIAKSFTDTKSQVNTIEEKTITTTNDYNDPKEQTFSTKEDRIITSKSSVDTGTHFLSTEENDRDSSFVTPVNFGTKTPTSEENRTVCTNGLECTQEKIFDNEQQNLIKTASSSSSTIELTEASDRSITTGGFSGKEDNMIASAYSYSSSAAQTFSFDSSYTTNGLTSAKKQLEIKDAGGSAKILVHENTSTTEEVNRTENTGSIDDTGSQSTYSERGNTKSDTENSITIEQHKISPQESNVETDTNSLVTSSSASNSTQAQSYTTAGVTVTTALNNRSTSVEQFLGSSNSPSVVRLASSTENYKNSAIAKSRAMFASNEDNKINISIGSSDIEGQATNNSKYIHNSDVREQISVTKHMGSNTGTESSTEVGVQSSTTINYDTSTTSSDFTERVAQASTTEKDNKISNATAIVHDFSGTEEQAFVRNSFGAIFERGHTSTPTEGTDTVTGGPISELVPITNKAENPKNVENFDITVKQLSLAEADLNTSTRSATSGATDIPISTSDLMKPDVFTSTEVSIKNKNGSISGIDDRTGIVEASTNPRDLTTIPSNEQKLPTNKQSYVNISTITLAGTETQHTTTDTEDESSDTKESNKSTEDAINVTIYKEAQTSVMEASNRNSNLEHFIRYSLSTAIIEDASPTEGYKKMSTGKVNSTYFNEDNESTKIIKGSTGAERQDFTFKEGHAFTSVETLTSTTQHDEVNTDNFTSKKPITIDGKRVTKTEKLGINANYSKLQIMNSSYSLVGQFSFNEKNLTTTFSEREQTSTTQEGGKTNTIEDSTQTERNTFDSEEGNNNTKSKPLVAIKSHKSGLNFSGYSVSSSTHKYPISVVASNEFKIAVTSTATEGRIVSTESNKITSTSEEDSTSTARKAYTSEVYKTTTESEGRKPSVFDENNTNESISTLISKKAFTNTGTHINTIEGNESSDHTTSTASYSGQSSLAEKDENKEGYTTAEVDKRKSSYDSSERDRKFGRISTIETTDRGRSANSRTSADISVDTELEISKTQEKETNSSTRRFTDDEGVQNSSTTEISNIGGYSAINQQPSTIPDGNIKISMSDFTGTEVLTSTTEGITMKAINSTRNTSLSRHALTIAKGVRRGRPSSNSTTTTIKNCSKANIQKDDKNSCINGYSYTNSSASTEGKEIINDKNHRLANADGDASLEEQTVTEEGDRAKSTREFTSTAGYISITQGTTDSNFEKPQEEISTSGKSYRLISTENSIGSTGHASTARSKSYSTSEFYTAKREQISTTRENNENISGLKSTTDHNTDITNQRSNVTERQPTEENMNSISFADSTSSGRTTPVDEKSKKFKNASGSNKSIRKDPAGREISTVLPLSTTVKPEQHLTIDDTVKLDQAVIIKEDNRIKTTDSILSNKSFSDTETEISISEEPSFEHTYITNEVEKSTTNSGFVITKAEKARSKHFEFSRTGVKILATVGGSNTSTTISNNKEVQTITTKKEGTTPNIDGLSDPQVEIFTTEEGYRTTITYNATRPLNSTNLKQKDFSTDEANIKRTEECNKTNNSIIKISTKVPQIISADDAIGTSRHIFTAECTESKQRQAAGDEKCKSNSSIKGREVQKTNSITNELDCSKCLTPSVSSPKVVHNNRNNVYNGPYAEGDFYHQPVHNYYNIPNVPLPASKTSSDLPYGFIALPVNTSSILELMKIFLSNVVSNLNH